VVVERIGEGHSTRTVLNGLAQDARVGRAGKKTWGLRSWGVEEYSGIVDEIVERIDRDGGSCDVESLVEELRSTFSVTENSVRLYLSTLAFVIEGGRVRRRTDDEPWTIDDRLAVARGAYRNDNALRLRLPVTKDVLRGSGHAIHPAVAVALAVAPGAQLRDR